MGDRQAMAVSPFAFHNGLELESAEQGRAVVSLPWSREMNNSGGSAHGGAIFTLADVAMGIAAFSVCPAGMIALTKGAQVRYLRRAVECRLIATAVVTHYDESLAKLKVEIHGAGELIAQVKADFAFKPGQSAVQGAFSQAIE